MNGKHVSILTVLFYSLTTFFCAANELKQVRPSVIERVQISIQNLPSSFYLTLIIIPLLILIVIFQKKTRPKTAAKQTIKGTSLVVPGNAQHIGARTEQQDAFAFSDLTNKELVKNVGILTVLADGMGGLSGGREASQTAVQTFLNTYLNSTLPTIEERLDDALYTSNKAVYEVSLQKRLQGQMSTTLIAVVIKGQFLYWCSAGDSRIYLYRKQSLLQLTRDYIYGNKLEEKAAPSTG